MGRWVPRENKSCTKVGIDRKYGLSLLPNPTETLATQLIYAMSSTYTLDMILQLKYMPIVIKSARIASNDWKF